MSHGNILTGVGNKPHLESVTPHCCPYVTQFGWCGRASSSPTEFESSILSNLLCLISSTCFSPSPPALADAYHQPLSCFDHYLLLYSRDNHVANRLCFLKHLQFILLSAHLLTGSEGYSKVVLAKWVTVTGCVDGGNSSEIQ